MLTYAQLKPLPFLGYQFLESSFSRVYEPVCVDVEDGDLKITNAT